MTFEDLRCHHVGYKINPFPMIFSMASLRPRNVQISYKGACGAPAPRSSLLHEHSNTTKHSRGEKAFKITNTESLFYTNAGDRLPSGVVSGVISCYLSS